MVCLAVLVQYWRVTDRQMDNRTHDNSIYWASIPSHCIKIKQTDITLLATAEKQMARIQPYYLTAKLTVRLIVPSDVKRQSVYW